MQASSGLICELVPDYPGETTVPPGGALIPKPSPTDFLAKTGSGTSVISMMVPVIGATTSTVVGVVELVTMQLPLSSRSELHRGEAESCWQQGSANS